MIFIGSHDGSDILVGTHAKKGNMIYVTTKSGDATRDLKEAKDIRIITGDSIKIIKGSSSGQVIIMKSGEPIAEARAGQTMSWIVSEEGSGGNLVYINEDGLAGIKEGEKRFNIEVITDEKGQSTEKSSYVIAKDGMVISVEGDDEAKVKEMGERIESGIGVSSGKSGTKPAEVKEAGKKTVKK
jgi:hypothetical protein